MIDRNGTLEAHSLDDIARDRVFQLRKSVLGDDAGPAPRYAGSLEGLAAWLPTTNPGEG